MIAKPAISSFDSVKGPSITMISPPEHRKRAPPFEIALRCRQTRSSQIDRRLECSQRDEIPQPRLAEVEAEPDEDSERDLD
jgi:hypothetical protein